ncbi:MAG: DUF4298 domain-containing protein [Oscillospiraceae bacterium]|nr:DUF4298 domain-containing protein [Oscillospiraceae bacterium]
MENIALVNRVKRMEIYFDAVLSALTNAPELISEDSCIKDMTQILSEYMDSGQWLCDYTADEQGLIPQDVKRGVLSQDGLYDLLYMIREER